MTRRGLTAFCAALVIACGGVTATGRLDGLFEAERARAAAEASPSLYAHAAEARQRVVAAEENGDDAAADDHATVARLWLAAALADADRAALLREAEALENEATAAEAVAADHERERAALLASRRRDRAMALATGEAERAFRHAEGYEPRRIRRDPQERRALWRETTRALLRRSALLLAAAEQLGAPAEEVARLRERREELAREPRPERVVTDANTLAAESLALLGRARAARPGPTDEERASFEEAARERGFTVERTERGLELRHARLGAAPAALVSQLSGLLRAHPHGPVMLVGSGGGVAATRRRADTLRRALITDGLAETRVSASGVGGATDPEVVVVLPGY